MTAASLSRDAYLGDPLAMTTFQLRIANRPVADYVVGPEIDPTLAPRPYLHPVRTLAGITVTDVFPPDHEWHLGAGLAIADVAGTNLWGGRTYVHGKGYIWLPDHGRIDHVAWHQHSDTVLDHELTWRAHDGTALLSEHRTITANATAITGAAATAVTGATGSTAAVIAPETAAVIASDTAVVTASGTATVRACDAAAVRASGISAATASGTPAYGAAGTAAGLTSDPVPNAGVGLFAAVPAPAPTTNAWALTFRTAMTNVRSTPIELRSPATNGRGHGAGYGGFFWRLPRTHAMTVEARDPGTADRARGELFTNGSALPELTVSGIVKGADNASGAEDTMATESVTPTQSTAGNRFSLTFSGLADDDRWFVRAAEYPAVGVAFASSYPLVLDPGATLARTFTVIVAEA